MKVLETLALQGKIHEKIYGKQRVYSAAQSQFVVVEGAQLKLMEAEIVSLSHQLHQRDEANRKIDAGYLFVHWL